MDYSTRSESGLVLARERSDSATLERQLKQIDRELALQAWPSLDGPPTWKVVRYCGPDRPPETICSWVTGEGDPLPLTEGILDMVRQLDRNTRSDYDDADARNEKFKAKLAKQTERDEEALIGDWRFPHGRPVLPRSQSLRRSRDKRRAEGDKV